MTRKHFEELALALRMSRPDFGGQIRYRQWETDVDYIANVCASFNPRFDRDRFRKACGLND